MEALPAAELRRTDSDVDHNVEDRPPNAPDQLCLTRLEVHPAHDPLPRAGMVVLDELIVDPELRQRLLAEALQEEAPFVAADDRGEQNWALELCLNLVHLRWRPRPEMSQRSTAARARLAPGSVAAGHERSRRRSTGGWWGSALRLAARSGVA